MCVSPSHFNLLVLPIDDPAHPHIPCRCASSQGRCKLKPQDRGVDDERGAAFAPGVEPARALDTTPTGSDFGLSVHAAAVRSNPRAGVNESSIGLGTNPAVLLSKIGNLCYHSATALRASSCATSTSSGVAHRVTRRRQDCQTGVTHTSGQRHHRTKDDSTLTAWWRHAQGEANLRTDTRPATVGLAWFQITVSPTLVPARYAAAAVGRESASNSKASPL